MNISFFYYLVFCNIFIFLFLDVPSLKLLSLTPKLIIFVLSTKRPKIILPNVRATTQQVAFALWPF